MKYAFVISESMASYHIFKEAIEEKEVECVIIISQFASLKKAYKLLKRLHPKFILFKLAEVLPYKGKVIRTCKKNGVDFYEIKDINDAAWFLKLFDIDAIINYSQQIFGKEILKQFECFNVHGGKLPEYKGMATYYWQYYNKEKYCYTTVHHMANKIDSGDIVLQSKFPIDYRKSVYNLLKHSSCLGAKLVDDLIKGKREDKKQVGDSNNYGSPKDFKTIKMFKLSEVGFRR